LITLAGISSLLLMTTCTPVNNVNNTRSTNSGGFVTTLAGPSFQDSGIAGNTATFNGPNGVAVDLYGNVYVADLGNNLIRMISTNGAVTTLAGSGAIGSADGMGTAASFNKPAGIAVDGAGNIYVADLGSNRIRKINPSGLVSTLAGTGVPGSTNGAANLASFNEPSGVAVDQSGNVYVTDLGNNLIRLISPSGVVRTLAGSGMHGSANGVATAASFMAPEGIAVDAGGNVYVADLGNDDIRKISADAVVTTLAGVGHLGYANGPDSTAGFSSPFGIAVDAAGNVFVSEQGNQEIREISTSGVVSIWAGSPNGNIGSHNGIGTSATFWFPAGLAVDGQDNVYVADYSNNMIREINSADVVSTLAGTGQAGSANTTTTTGRSTFYDPTGVAVDASGNIYVADQFNNLIRKISSTGIVSTLAGNGNSGWVDGPDEVASFKIPTGVAVDPTGNVYVADLLNNIIRKISSSGIVSTLAGNGTGGDTNGPAASASFKAPYGVAVDAAGNVYVADDANNLIRKITSTGVVSTLAGNGNAAWVDGPGTTASFYNPTGLAVDVNGNVFVADAGNNRIREISPTGVVSTFAGNGTFGSANGNGTSASFNHPTGVAVDIDGNIYVADQKNNLIRMIAFDGTVSTWAGNGKALATNGRGSGASFSSPTGIAVDAAGNVYVADQGNNLIRKITP